ncbi:hypothetical protein COHA_010753 [Chlorella ohadii]|uniref:Uncharacterized protein n=1 Tax=Chlorella ohadii TaxID=2649997 RepID=A0AAD5DFQ3_9CHLO|nr:hypothetical protein COHA_010753 [Chlorella ohadii]
MYLAASSGTRSRAPDMTTKPDGHAHGLPGHRAANRPALVVVLGLCLSCALWSLTGFHGAHKSSAKPRKISEEALDELAAGLALRGGRWVVRPPAAGWGAAPYWGPTAQASTRGGKYVITAAAEVELERLHVLAASLRRWSPATKLVLFTAAASGSTDVLQAAGIEVLPFQLPNDTALDMYRFELYRGYLASLLERDSEAGVLLAGSPELLVQSDPWQHPLVQRMLDEDALLFTLEGGLAVGDVPLKALPQSQQLVEACFGTAAAKAMAGSPVSCAGLAIGGVGAALKYVSQLQRVAQAAASPECRLEGGDMAAHNYLLHHLGPAGNLSFAAHVRRNWESPMHATAYGWPVVVDKEGALSRIYRAMYPVQPVRSGDLRWDGPECVDGAQLQLDAVKTCPPPKDDKGGMGAGSKGNSAPAATAGAAEAAAAGKSPQDKAGRGIAAEQSKGLGKPAAAAAASAAVAKKSTGAAGGDRRRLRR